MKNLKVAAAAAAVVVMTSACGGAQSHLEPTITSTNPVSNSTLQFAVGTANIAGTVGLNVVETFRQTGANAGTSILTNAPAIVGPAGFVVPATADAGADAGTNHISSGLVTNIAAYPPQTTFFPAASPGSAVAYGIASSYGITPGGVTSPGAGQYPSLVPYPQPFYAAGNPTLTALGAAAGSSGAVQVSYIGGPPAFVPPAPDTSTRDGNFGNVSPGSPEYGAIDYGYQLGFDTFQVAPTAGTYTLNVQVPTGVNSNGTSAVSTVTATSSIKAAGQTTLPAWTTAPTFAPDGAGGGTITTNFPVAGGATEEYIEIVDLGALQGDGTLASPACQVTGGGGNYYYTIQVTPGAATATVPDLDGANQVGAAQPSTICPGDEYAVYGFAADYPLKEAGFPASTGNPSPTILGPNGTDDITLSTPFFSPGAVTAGVTITSHGRKMNITAPHEMAAARRK